jgi:recombinational DNA repair protein (RecF pathway)
MKEEVKVEAINLHTKKLNGYKLITAYSREYGLVKMSGSKLGGRSEPFVKNNYWIKISNSEIHQIKHSEFLHHQKGLIDDFDKLIFACQLSEYLESCSHFGDDHSSEIYELFDNCLALLGEGSQDLIHIMNYFLWNLSGELGYQPNLFGCLDRLPSCHLKENKDLKCWFDLDHGDLFCERCSNGEFGEIVQILPSVLQSLIGLNEKNYLQFKRENLKAEEFVKSILHRHIQRHCLKKIKLIGL